MKSVLQMEDEEITKLIDPLIIKTLDRLQAELERKGQKKTKEIVCCMLTVFERCLLSTIYHMHLDCGAPREVLLNNHIANMKALLAKIPIKDTH